MKKYINIYILVILSLLAWYKIIFQAFTGEAYWYFIYGFNQGVSVFKFDFGTTLFFEIFKRIFRDNLFLYQGFALMIIVLLGILFYFLVYEIKSSKFLAFTAAVIFSINYGSLFEMMATGNYHDFAQRELFFILLIPSFMFFIRFLKHRKRKDYLLSVSLYAVSIFLAHYGVFFFPLYLTYFLALLIVDNKKRKNNFIFLSPRFFSFILITVLILYLDIHASGGSYIAGRGIFPYLFNNSSDVLFNIVRQLTYITFPENELLMRFGLYTGDRISSLYIPILCLYFFSALYIWFKEVKLRIPMLASVLFIPIVFVLNMYLRSEEVKFIIYGSRYFFVPSIGFALFWSLFLYCLYNSKLLKYFSFAAIGIFVYIQITMINQGIEQDQYKHIAILKSLEYLKTLSPSLKKDTFVLTPYVLGYYASSFAQLFYAPKGVTFVPMVDRHEIKWNLKDYHRRFDPKRDLILDLYYTDNKIINRTSEYNKIIFYE